MGQRNGQSGAGMILHPATAQSLVYPTTKRPPVRRLTPEEQTPPAPHKILRVYPKGAPGEFQRVEIHLRQRLDEFVQSREVQA